MERDAGHKRYRYAAQARVDAHRPPGTGRSIPLSVLLILWGLFIVYGTTLPFEFSMTGEQAWARWRGVLEHPWPQASIPDVVSNVLLFLPWGLLLAARQAREGVRLAAALAVAGLTGFALSGSVEILQLFAPTRTPSLLDLTANTSGSILGALGGWLAARRAWPRVEPVLEHLVARRPLAAIALAVAAGLSLATMSPYDVSIDIGDLKASIAQARPIPFGPQIRGPQPPADPLKWAGEFLPWMLYGGILALALREGGRGGTRVVAEAALLAGLLAGVIELGQLAIRSRGTDATSVALAVAGTAVGAWVVRAAGPRVRPRRWIGPALVVWGISMILANWTPIRVTHFQWSELRTGMLVPFLAYYRRTDIYALSDILNQTLAFSPLGLLLAARHGRMPVWGAAIAGIVVGIVLEAGQLFLEDRTADVTDVLSAAVGAALGTVLWRWAEAVRAAAVVRAP